MSGEALNSTLQEWADELEDAAETTEDQRSADACAFLAALGKGEEPPEDVAERVRERYLGGSDEL